MIHKVTMEIKREDLVVLRVNGTLMKGIVEEWEEMEKGVLYEVVGSIIEGPINTLKLEKK